VTAARPAVTVAVTAGAGNASAWIGHAQRIELARVDHAGLRMWCDEENLPFRDDEARTRLLAVTGGWPAVVTRTAELAAAAAPTAGSSGRLVDTGTGLAPRDGGLDLAAAAGVGQAQPVLGAAFATSATLTASTGEDPVTLAGLLALDDTADLPALAAAAG